jgi:hypothetical protein
MQASQLTAANVACCCDDVVSAWTSGLALSLLLQLSAKLAVSSSSTNSARADAVNGGEVAAASLQHHA